MGTIQSDHYVSFVGDHTFFSAFEESLLLHQFEGVKNSCFFQPGQKDPTESSSSDALDDIKVFNSDIFVFFLLPDGLNLQELSLENFDGLTSLEIVVFEDVSSSGGLPVADTGRAELWVV